MSSTEQIIIDEVITSLRADSAETLIISSLRTRGVSLIDAQRYVVEGRARLDTEGTDTHSGEAGVLRSFDSSVVSLPRVDQPTNSVSLGEHCGTIAMSVGERLVVVDDFLTTSECQYFIEEAQGRLTKSSVVNEANGASIMDPARTSSGAFFIRGSSPIVERVETRIANFLNWPFENGEALSLLKYLPGEEYKPHFDYFDPRSSGFPDTTRLGGQRVGTVIMYLNDVHAGGCTYFPESKIQVHPKQGRMLFFSYNANTDFGYTRHAGMPVVDGEKYIITKWLRERSL